MNKTKLKKKRIKNYLIYFGIISVTSFMFATYEKYFGWTSRGSFASKENIAHFKKIPILNLFLGHLLIFVISFFCLKLVYNIDFENSKIKKIVITIVLFIFAALLLFLHIKLFRRSLNY